MRILPTALTCICASTLVILTISLHPVRILLDSSPDPHGPVYRLLTPISNPTADPLTVGFLLLLPVACLLVCLTRNVLGLETFGTFAPALLGLAFRTADSPTGVFLLMLVVVFGWHFRSLLAPLRLLPVPRSALLISYISVLLAVATQVAVLLGVSQVELPGLLPMVILAGVIERFRATEEDGGLPQSTRILGQTMLVTALVWVVVRQSWLLSLVMRQPEWLGLVFAGQLWVGRYAGLRLLERLRFRSLPRAEVIGMNFRNARLLADETRRGVYPLVDDKLEMAAICERLGIPTPAILTTIDANETDPLSRLLPWAEGVVKPARGFGGRGILILERDRDGNWRRADGRTISPPAIREHLREIASGVHSLGGRPDVAIFQKRIAPHPFFEPFARRGIADIRLIVRDGRVIESMVRLPTLASGGRANLHQGGIGAGIDPAKGTTVRAFHEGREIDRHPDTGAGLIGLAIPHWPEVCRMAVRVARATGLPFAGIDIVLDGELGPMLLEANARPGLGIQLACGRGLKRAMAGV